TDEAVRNGSIKKVKKRGNVGEPRKDKNGRDDNKRTRTGNGFATTINFVGRENTGTCPSVPPATPTMHPKCHTPRRGLDGIRVRGRDVIIIRTQGTRERPLMDVLEIITRCIV
ncbi:hypothetical protein Tco_0330864, partial [Tanacetum coccineum]